MLACRHLDGGANRSMPPDFDIIAMQFSEGVPVSKFSGERKLAFPKNRTSGGQITELALTSRTLHRISLSRT